jgi:hemerythrin
MALITWSSAYSLDHLQIDTQHRTLVGLLNQLHEAMSAGHGKDVLGKVLTDLAGYTVVHFQTEEALMREHAYPERDAHKRQHDELTAEVLRFKRDYETGKASMSLQVLTFLKSWLTGHIQGADAKLAAFLRKTPVPVG